MNFVFIFIFLNLVGCWIMYKVKDNRMLELVAYEIMSANDAPERDPMDWYVF
jgi:peptide-N4-(N-acetyl-beta-glucosaminyl)asparagine amidase